MSWKPKRFEWKGHVHFSTRGLWPKQINQIQKLKTLHIKSEPSTPQVAAHEPLQRCPKMKTMKLKIQEQKTVWFVTLMPSLVDLRFVEGDFLFSRWESDHLGIYNRGCVIFERFLKQIQVMYCSNGSKELVTDEHWYIDVCQCSSKREGFDTSPY